MSRGPLHSPRLLPESRQGFTLVEALVAMLLSTLVVILVTSTFLAQNQFYADVLERAALQENARGTTALVTAELRGVPAGGILTAEPTSVVYRVPLVVGGVCAVSGGELFLILPLEGEGVPGPEVTGYAVRDSLDAGWVFTPATWGSIHRASGSGPASACASVGSDTVGATPDFHRVGSISATPGLQPGDLLLLYKEMELRLAPSLLEPGYRALFWGPAGGTLVEYATGLSSSSAFAYRLAGQSTFQGQVTGATNLRNIEGVRIHAQGIAPASRPGRNPLTFDLDATVTLRNVR